MGLLHFYKSEWSGRQWQRTSNLSTSNVTLRGINLWYSSDTVWSFVPIARNTFLTICAWMTKREISRHFFFSIDQQQQHQRISTILVCCHYYLYSKNIISIDLNMRVNHFATTYNIRTWAMNLKHPHTNSWDHCNCDSSPLRPIRGLLNTHRRIP